MTIFEALRLVLQDKRYLLAFILVSIAMFWLLLYIPIRAIPGNDFAFQLSILSPKNRLLFLGLSILTAVSVVFNIYLLAHKNLFKTTATLTLQGGGGILSGIMASIFGTASCSACIATVFGFLGFSGVLFLVAYRDLIAVGSAILLLISLYFTSQKVLGVCKLCKI